MANTINPDQIRPGANGQLVGTVAGASGLLNVVAGTGITVTLSGNNIVISASAPVTPLTITSFTGGQSGEIGQAFVNPAFALAYGGTPTSANITNTAAIDTPHALSSPYTSATLSGSFSSNTPAFTITFTAHASDGTNSPTATQVFTFNERIFGGVGAVGASSSVTAAGTTAVLSTSDALPSAGLGAETVGQVFGPYSPSGQAIYLLLTGSSHTFQDPSTGFSFAMNSPLAVTFVNQFGVAVTMYLYQSTNPLYTPFSVKVLT